VSLINIAFNNPLPLTPLTKSVVGINFSISLRNNFPKRSAFSANFRL
jgi:hypothetical protein